MRRKKKEWMMKRMIWLYHLLQEIIKLELRLWMMINMTRRMMLTKMMELKIKKRMELRQQRTTHMLMKYLK